MDTSDSCLELTEIHIHSPFSKLFPRRPHVLDALKQHIHDNGFDEAFPLILAYGHWTEHDVLLDGHCRRDVCEVLGIEKVPVVRRRFDTEDAALAYMIHVQKDRRNLTDAEILNCVATLDHRQDPSFRGNQHISGEAQRCASPESGKSAEKTADLLGISARKVEQARTVFARGDEAMKQAIRSGEKSINKVYKEIQVKRKEEQEGGESGAEVIPQVPDHVSSVMGTAEPAENHIKPEEAVHGDQETREATLASSVAQILVPTEASDSDNGWALEVVSAFDSGSIDYIILGQGAPPEEVTDHQHLFAAPRIAPGPSEAVNAERDTVNEDTPPAAPPIEPSPVDLTNYDEEGWYAMEQEWATSIPGFVPEPTEGIEVTTAIEEPSVGENATSGHEEPKPSEQEPVQAADPALEKLAVHLELGHGEWTRLEKWAKRSGVITCVLPDSTRKIDRRKFFALAQNITELNNILKGPVKSEYAWFPETFHRICRENGYDVPLPDCTDGFEANLLLDHLWFKGVYSGGKHHPQNEDSITAKLEFLVENWGEVSAAVKKDGFVTDRSDSPSFDWMVRHGENVFDCIHHKMAAISEFRLKNLFEDAGMAWN